ncbi:hypothetical protein ACJ73_05599 [Blastomyces percursus]|uniref:Uncharacterized protein n=1 Tax=Blastomyces percursus TaxID=1658174 RepID=A0A1J9R4W8_9EURO|nr:hypothetical protein ACJ73_05599 [Blastomyces percursus]
MHTPTPPGTSHSSQVSWATATPHNVHQLEQQTEKVMTYIKRRIQSPPSPTNRALSQLVKGCQMAMHSAAILAAENRELKAANAKQKRKRERGHTYVAQEGSLRVEEGLGRVQSSCDDDEAYRESDDDDHVTRRLCKRRKLWTRRSSGSAATPAACTGDPSPTAVINNKPRKRNPTKKHGKNPASEASRVPSVPLEDAVTNRSGDDIPVSGFLSSYLTGSTVCYTITFCHEEAGRLPSANANGLSSPGREGRPSCRGWCTCAIYLGGRRATERTQGGGSHGMRSLSASQADPRRLCRCGTPPG